MSRRGVACVWADACMLNHFRSPESESSSVDYVCCSAGGYLVELTSGGLCLATFTDPLHAVAWSVCLVEVLKVSGCAGGGGQVWGAEPMDSAARCAGGSNNSYQNSCTTHGKCVVHVRQYGDAIDAQRGNMS
eukprot:182538-Chlamydomonas_euryale.AAC.1